MAFWNLGEVRSADDIRNMEADTMKRFCEDLFYMAEGKAQVEPI